MISLGSLCSGYGGLELGVQSVLGGHTAWVSDVDKGACRILAHRFPNVPNIGDMTTVDWTTVPTVDVLTGGTPCQDLSHAGKRAGMSAGTRSNLWVAMREAIAALRPRLIVWENVSGAYSAEADSDLGSDPRLLDGTRRRAGEPVLRALGRVLGDLDSLGYMGGWHGLRAADVGAPHGRLRVFVVAVPDDGGPRVGRAGESGRTEPVHVVCRGSLLPRPNQRGSSGDLMLPSAVQLLPTPTMLPTPSAADGNGGGRYSSEGHQRTLPGEVRLLPTPTANEGGQTSRSGDRIGEQLIGGIVRDNLWGQYAAAIHSWEQVTRPAPPPTETGPKGNPRLSAAFSEWLMGLPAGWVTDVPGITRNEALKALGNGVVPQQAAAAVRFLLDVIP